MENEKDIDEKLVLHIFDFFHNYKHLEKHFKEHIELNKDYKIKQITLN